MASWFWSTILLAKTGVHARRLSSVFPRITAILGRHEYVLEDDEGEYSYPAIVSRGE